MVRVYDIDLRCYPPFAIKKEATIVRIELYGDEEKAVLSPYLLPTYIITSFLDEAENISPREVKAINCMLKNGFKDNEIILNFYKYSIMNETFENIVKYFINSAVFEPKIIEFIDKEKVADFLKIFYVDCGDFTLWLGKDF